MNPAFHDHFSGVANRYADFRPHYPAELFDYLGTLVPRDSRVWDCAAGNGQATLEQLLGYFGTWSATNRYIKATGRNPLEPLSAALSRAWDNVDSPLLIVWPLSLRLGRK